jgi:hypothetical protein
VVGRWMLTLDLTLLPADRVRGTELIHGIPNRLPTRSLFLHPLAARSFLDEISDKIVVTDMLRSAEASLIAVAAGNGSRPPGYSGHNFGFSIDVALEPTLSTRGISKPALDRWLVERGWYCARRDAQRGLDDNHYDYLRAGAELDLASTADPIKDIEQLIVRLHADDLFPGDEECQVILRKLRLYGGLVDGLIGRHTAEAIAVFQRGWNLALDPTVTPGALDARTRRTLAFVAHQRRLAPVP